MEFRTGARVRPRNIDKQVKNYIKRVAPPARLARSKVAPHYEAIELFLRSGYSWKAAHRFLTEELLVEVSEAAMRQYVVRRRRLEEQRRSVAAPARGTATRASQPPVAAGARTTPSPPAPSNAKPSTLRVGDIEIPEGGTSDWSILSAIRRDAEQDFRELGEAAKRRRRERRRTS